ncbi:hydantoinase/oxoprolinase family protein [Conexibacter sp. CPCC 206217]|uniref:hydantoinase/oxoprolinase family protein n=1 Tax=Conexibacter sp. CPCC 206217 TaxID=3064574 RepID=UPI00271F8A3A|nr:hydantoinase/oxoprolinase family protein [Conexibacter sp. CPCC 206217]MDO8212577.1 hydantoinase/oxoprolinase family protein [Conexibacter sp. CPCC 206217]
MTQHNGSTTAWEVGVDIGGTFTDLVFYDRRSERLTVRKVSSTREDPSRAMLAGLEQIELPSLGRLVHASTVVLNALLQRRGAEIAMITTLGFRDHVEIGDTRRYTGGLFDARWRREQPLALPRSRRFTIAERTAPDGTVLHAPDAAELDAVCDQLEAAGVEAVAICLLNSYADGANEELVRAHLERRLPDVLAIPSSQIPEFREYPRFTTAILNAFCAPIASRYVARLGAELERAGYDRGVAYMGSAGGIVSGPHIVASPTTMLWGGVVGGVTASTNLGHLIGVPHMVTFDMGGTSTDVALIRDHAPSVVAERTLGAYPLAIPQVDVHSIGAGGGSIAYMEEGVLKVGPRSAGAEPGPACYGRGGEQLTVTDANLLLGRLPASSKLAGDMPLDAAAARAAAERLLPASGLASVEELAAGVIEIADTHMMGAIREVSVERGEDPAELALVAFGGAGPMHACAIADKLGIATVVVPREAGDFSALGLLLSDHRHDLVRGFLRALPETEPEDLEHVFEELEREGCALLVEEGFTAEEIRLTRLVDMRYRGQSYEEQIVARELGADWLAQTFQDRYRRRYGYQRDASMCELVSLRVTATGIVGKPSLVDRGAVSDDGPPPRTEVIFGGERMQAPILRREQLPAGAAVSGPAVLEEYSSTMAVPPGWAGHVNELGCLMLERKA